MTERNANNDEGDYAGRSKRAEMVARKIIDRVSTLDRSQFRQTDPPTARDLLWAVRDLPNEVLDDALKNAATTQIDGSTPDSTES